MKDLMSVKDVDELLVRLFKLLRQLPPPHFRTAKALFTHLHQMSQQHDRTSMPSKNVAICWAPNLLKSRKLMSPKQYMTGDNKLTLSSAAHEQALKEINQQTALVEFVIARAPILFSENLVMLQNIEKGSAIGMLVVLLSNIYNRSSL